MNSLTSDGMSVKFDDNYAIISKGVSPYQFHPIKAVKLDGLYKLSQELFELNAQIPHVSCLAREPLSEEILRCHLADNTKSDVISIAHYMFGHQSAECTRYLCKCNSFTNV